MNQKEAVFQVIKDLRRGDVDTDKPVVLTKQEKQVAAQKLFEGFKKGKVAYNHEMPSDDKLLLYISGLVSNWLRKDKRLNGQRNYTPRRPGARALPIGVDSNIDPDQLEALRTLAGGEGEEVQVFVIKRPAAAAQIQAPAKDEHESQ
jgi:hypothetical protein